tara:strand:+ start:449 stop:598 length:150 start_codon:yes stop_codon:yes gene_type:complete
MLPGLETSKEKLTKKELLKKVKNVDLMNGYMETNPLSNLVMELGDIPSF